MYGDVLVPATATPRPLDLSNSPTLEDHRKAFLYELLNLSCAGAGGYFHGSYVMEFEDSSSASSVEASLKASFESGTWGVKLAVDGNFKQLVEKTAEITSHYGT
jgi:hypothetical protein